jgi:hypothetical protein
VTFPSAIATAVSAAATVWVHERLSRPLHSARVVHAGLDAVYVDDGEVCLGLLSRTAVGVPCGLQTSLPDLGLIEPGSPALVGDGMFLVGPHEVRVARVVDASVPRIDSVPRFDLAGGEALPVEALALLTLRDPAAVRLLLGRGSGLTPYGDDVLCGWLATTLALGRPVTEMAGEVERLSARTTLLSATLLACAARGEVIAQFRSLLSTGSGLDELLAVGHTSGAGLALGMRLADSPHDGARLAPTAAGTPT